jgi:O-acetyl-ADP-ribose deacetylase (regulator of RNase III)/uncharacterized protein YwgA
MIDYTTKNIFEIDVEAIINTVNCVGVMGKGLAFQCKQFSPENFKAYQQACQQGKIQPGHIFVFETGTFYNPKYILNFPTKRHWKENSRLEDIQLGLKDLIKTIKRLDIKSIAIPPLGCGNGRLDWPTVHPLILNAVQDIAHVKVQIIKPHEFEIPQVPKRGEPKITRARALFIKLIDRYKKDHYVLSLLEIQKLAYFLQESGEPLKLKFEQAYYGPFANNLNKVLARMEGHFIHGFNIDRPKPMQEISLINDAIKVANTMLQNDIEALERLKTIENLIEGFQSPYGLELLATVHWVIHHATPNANTLSEAIDRIHQWSTSKKNKFSSQDIETTWDHLSKLNWI